MALNNLKKLVNNNIIVFCKSDKDGKILVLNHDDYILIIKRELRTYRQINDENLRGNTLIKTIKSEAELMTLQLYKQDIIDKKLLYESTGITVDENDIIKKATGSKAKFFLTQVQVMFIPY